MKIILSIKNFKNPVQALFLALLIPFTFSASAQISFLGASSAHTAGNGTKKLSFLHTVNTAVNFLVVTVTTQDKPIVSVKYAQQTLTMAVTKVRNSMNVAIYYFNNPPAGTDTVIIETSSSTDITGGADNYGNVNLINPIIQTASSSAQSSSPSLTINSATGDLVIDAIGTVNKQVNNSSAQSLAHNNHIGSNPNASSYKDVTATSTTMNWSITGGSDDWAMVGIVIKAASAPGALPLKLISFNAYLNKSKVELNWRTTAEINMSHFVIEKSLDGANFSEAGFIFARGNETAVTAYDFSDNINATQEGVVYYRLRSVDIDGKYQYSVVRIIRISKQANYNITILAYPNPVINELRITIPSNWQSKKVTYELFNAGGQVSKKTETANSNQTETMNVNSLAPGFYFVRVTCNGETAQQKIIRQ